MATDYLAQALGTKTPGQDVSPSPAGQGKEPPEDAAAVSLWRQINTWLGSLSRSQREQALRIISGWGSDWVQRGPFYDIAGISVGDLNDLANTVQGQIKGVTVPGSDNFNQQQAKQDVAPGLGMPPAAASTATPSQAPAGAQGTATQPAMAALSETSGLTQQQYVDLMRLWGLSSPADVDQMVGAYRDSYMVTYQLNQYADYVGGAGQTVVGGAGPSATPPSSPFAAAQGQEAAASGQTSTLTAPAWTMTLAPDPSRWDPDSPMKPAVQRQMDKEIGLPPESQRLLTPQDVYAAAMYSGGGIAQRVIQQYKERWLNDMGGVMPADLEAQLQAAVAGLDSSQLQQWLESSMAKPGASISIGALDDIFVLYEQEHPTATEEHAAEFSRVDQAMMSTLGRHATEADLQALGANPTKDDLDRYINQQPYSVGGVQTTYGQYDSTYQYLSSQWSKYFGGQTPTPQQIVYFLGKSQAEVNEYINNSPSRVPGVTIGRYNDYVGFVNSLDTSSATTHAFSMGIDDSLIADLHQHLQSQETQQAQPGPLS